MIDLKLDRDALRVAVLAHPDDESLWCAGLILANPGGWRIYCCSIPARDPVRAFKFYTACEHLGAQGLVMPWTENPIGQKMSHLENLPSFVGAGVIVTHGAWGEYGHSQHIHLHRFIVGRYGGKVPIMAIGYTPDGRSAGEFKHELGTVEWAQKQNAIAAYDHPMQWHGQKMPTGAALLLEYGARFDLRKESYDKI